MPVNDRIKFLIDTLDLSTEEFSNKIGAKEGTTRNYLYRGSMPSAEYLEKIFASIENIDASWLLSGNGKPFKEPTELTTAYTKMQVYNNGKDRNVEHQQIPLYNLMAAAGLVHLYNSNNYILDYISIPNLPKCDGAVYVAGDSMYPLLKSGDIVIFRKVSDMQDGIFYGEMHVVEYQMSDDYITAVKFVQKSEREGYIKLVSENRHHQTKEIPLNKVRALAVVKASIRINAMV